MKKILIVVSILMFLTNSVKAQKTADIGFWGGAGTYFGDMTQIDLGSSLGFNYGAFVRYNFNSRLAVRLHGINGKIGATGMYETDSWEFQQNVTNLSLMAEINFFKYYLGKKEMPFTTYLLGGAGVAIYDAVSLHLPVGFGAKFNVTENVGLGIEFQVNKYFDDSLDYLDDPRAYTLVDNSVTPAIETVVSYNDTWHNNDYTTYVGVYLTYKLNLSKKACPVYEYE